MNGTTEEAEDGRTLEERYEGVSVALRATADAVERARQLVDVAELRLATLRGELLAARAGHVQALDGLRHARRAYRKVSADCDAIEDQVVAAEGLARVPRS